jgi:MIP family channel proteins
VQDRGLAAYIAELIGTFFLVFAVGVVVTLFVATSADAQQGSDFAVVGLVHAFVLFGLILTFGAASGGHFNPAVTLAAASLRRIDPLDAVVYILAQLSGGVLGALAVKGFLLDEGRLSGYGAATVSPLLGGDFAGMLIEAIGTFLFVLVICSVAFNPRARQEWAPLAIGTALGGLVMILGPLTGGSFNPARWFGPALIGDEFGGTWPYLLGPIIGALLAAAVYRFVIAGPQYALGTEPPTTDARAAAQVVKDAETRAREG